MKKLMICMAMLCGFAMAQDTMSHDATMKKSAHHHKKHAMKEKTVKGCLHKDGENMWLETRMGKYHVMSKDDLSAHDGHEVKVTGMASKGPLPGAEKDVKHLEASKVDMVADKCAMGTKAMKMKQGETAKN